MTLSGSSRVPVGPLIVGMKVRVLYPRAVWQPRASTCADESRGHLPMCALPSASSAASMTREAITMVAALFALLARLAPPWLSDPTGSERRNGKRRRTRRAGQRRTRWRQGSDSRPRECRTPALSRAPRPAWAAKRAWREPSQNSNLSRGRWDRRAPRGFDRCELERPPSPRRSSPLVAEITPRVPLKREGITEPVPPSGKRDPPLLAGVLALSSLSAGPTPCRHEVLHQVKRFLHRNGVNERSFHSHIW